MLRRWWGVYERERVVKAGWRSLKRGKVLGRIGEDRRIITVRRGIRNVRVYEEFG